MSCLIPLFSRVIYSVGNELLIVSLASSRPTSHCIILHETLGGGGVPHLLKMPGVILKYGYSI